MKKLDVKALGCALGFVWAVALFVATIWVVIELKYFDAKGGSTLILLNRFYPGYNVNVRGAFIGIPYAFVNGFVGGYLVAWVYNKIVRK